MADQPCQADPMKCALGLTIALISSGGAFAGIGFAEWFSFNAVVGGIIGGLTPPSFMACAYYSIKHGRMFCQSEPSDDSSISSDSGPAVVMVRPPVV